MKKINHLTKKFVLGTANFSMKYGLKNNKSFLHEKLIAKILKKLIKKRTLFIDTARAYYGCEKKLGSFPLKKFKIITKIRKPENNTKLNNFIEKEFKKSLKNLRKKSLYGVLLHRPGDLKGPAGKKIYKALNSLKNQKLVKKIGYSINSPEDLNLYYKKFKPDIVQAPLNVFDQRMSDSGWIDKLSKNNTEIHIRSIFLQGLLLMDKKKIPSKFKKFSKIFNNWHDWLKKNKLSKYQACLNFILKQKKISKIIIGIDNYNHLSEIFKFKKSKYNFNFDELKIKNENLINPTKWKKL